MNLASSTADGEAPDAPRPPSPPAPQRLESLDRLTVLATLAVFFFHCARYFNFEDWHVKNAELSAGLSLFVAFVAQWVMPLFFVLSGISSFHSIERRGAGRYLVNRLRRLVVPLLCGIFVLLVPVQVWIERVTHGGFAGSLLDFYPHYFDGFYAFGGNFAWMGLHLWYLEMLFVFTLLTCPVFVALKSPRFRERVAALGASAGRPGALFLWGLPLFLVEALVNLQPQGVGMRAFGGWSPFSYLFFFLAGYRMALDPRCREALVRARTLALGLGVLTAGFMFVFPVDLSALGRPVQYIVTVLWRSLNSWFWLVALLGWEGRPLALGGTTLKSAREAALPFYILHQTVIVVLGYVLAGWSAGVALKYLVLAVLSLSVICTGYGLLIRPFRPLRFVFGMKDPR